jgi:Fe2+ transport system protein FeoA
MKLTDLKDGETAIIKSIDESYLKIILIERGFYPGQKICRVLKSGKNGPTCFSIPNSVFCLRKEESDLINI